jgi:hypothetical protein
VFRDILGDFFIVFLGFFPWIWQRLGDRLFQSGSTDLNCGADIFCGATMLLVPEVSVQPSVSVLGVGGPDDVFYSDLVELDFFCHSDMG